MEFRVRISPELMESMTLAAIEAYCFSRPGRKSKNGAVKKKYTHEETLGYLWGQRRVEKGRTFIHLERMSVSISASRAPDSVVPNEKAARLMNDVVKRWSPQLSFLGDFHSHPYNDLAEVKKHSGYEFSQDDYQYLMDDDFSWKAASNRPLMIAVTVCRLGKVTASELTYIRSNICKYAIGEFQFWVNAAVGYIQHGERCITANKRSDVTLDAGNWYMNDASVRLSEED